jgi:tripartite-type tricarboxylate transporter receptor subunit TctC
MSRAGRVLLLPLLVWLAPALALAQVDYPNRPIKIIVPLAPGGTADILSRIIGEKLSIRCGQPVVIENRAGDGQHIGTEAVDRLWQAAAEALRMPEVEVRRRGLGAAPGGATPAATAAFLRQETERWSKVIAQASIKPE